MRTSSPSLEDVEDHALKVTVHGLARRETVRRLIRALAAIPCYPLVIFKIDRSGRLLGVIDARMNADETHDIYYVQVRHWGREPDQVPDIGWVFDPRKISRGLRRQAERKLLDYETGVRRKPMVVSYSSKAHLKRCLPRVQE